MFCRMKKINSWGMYVFFYPSPRSRFKGQMGFVFVWCVGSVSRLMQRARVRRLGLSWLSACQALQLFLHFAVPVVGLLHLWGPSCSVSTFGPRCGESSLSLTLQTWSTFPVGSMEADVTPAWSDTTPTSISGVCWETCRQHGKERGSS